VYPTFNELGCPCKQWASECREFSGRRVIGFICVSVCSRVLFNLIGMPRSILYIKERHLQRPNHAPYCRGCRPLKKYLVCHPTDVRIQSLTHGNRHHSSLAHNTHNHNPGVGNVIGPRSRAENYQTACRWSGICCGLSQSRQTDKQDF
jgi:hypothetical protein